ncbi:MAG: N-acetylglucosamine-6-phosphate deacetylase [Acidimicrobiales bacterium]|nr:N-acetylglucosamine-6-phosphate deacetylase [Acidimicrobiales bacterium]
MSRTEGKEEATGNTPGVVFINCNALIDGVFRPDTSILISQGQITSINIDSKSNMDSLRDSGVLTSNAEIDLVDLENKYLIPGLVDLQVNGGGGVGFQNATSSDDFLKAVKAHINCGTTSLLPTITTNSIEKMLASIDLAYSSHLFSPNTVLGIHLEGPLLSPKRKGIHNEKYLLKELPSEVLDAIEDVLVKSRNDANPFKVLITLAPEIAGIPLIEKLVKLGVKVSFGHSEASFEEAEVGFGERADLVTHLFNATEPISGRSPGLVTSALMRDDVNVSLVCDGNHLHDEIIKLVLKLKSYERVILVSDAMPIVGTQLDQIEFDNLVLMRSENGLVVSHGEDGEKVQDQGKLAGSSTSLLECALYLTKSLLIPFERAIEMASLNPAHYLQLRETLGSIQKGGVADFLVVDSSLHLERVYKDGRELSVET